MPNSLTATGLTTATRAELIAFWYAAYLATYGVDLTTADPSDPDVLIINTYVQAALDLEDFVATAYTSFDPDQAFGVTLDQRVSINGIQREQGTPTIQNLTVVTNKSLNLVGLDVSQSPFTYADAQGNQWQLRVSQSPAGPGSYVYDFQSANLGPVVSALNSINVSVTVVLGVVSVNNPTVATTLGIAFEQDSALRLRRQKSVSIASTGYFAGLLAGLENIPGMISAFIYENDADGVVNGIPGHSIWVVTDGTASPAAIAQTIYIHRSTASGMKGSQTYIITQADGSPFLIRWDQVVLINLFTKLTVQSFDGINPPNIAGLISEIPNKLIPGVSASVNTNELIAAAQAIDPNSFVTNPGFCLSAGGVYSAIATPAALNDQFDINSGSIIVLPIMVTSPNSIVSVVADVVVTNLTIKVGLTEQMSAIGGYTLASWMANIGAISGAGLFTAPGAPTTGVITFTDSLGNIGTANVTVTL